MDKYHVHVVLKFPKRSPTRTREIVFVSRDFRNGLCVLHWPVHLLNSAQCIKICSITFISIDILVHGNGFISFCIHLVFDLFIIEFSVSLLFIDAFLFLGIEYYCNAFK